MPKYFPSSKEYPSHLTVFLFSRSQANIPKNINNIYFFKKGKETIQGYIFVNLRDTATIIIISKYYIEITAVYKLALAYYVFDVVISIVLGWPHYCQKN